MFKKFRGNKKAYIIRIFFAALIFILSILAFLPDYKPFTAIMELNPGPAVAKWISDFSIITLIVVLLHFAIAFLFGRFYCSTVCPFGILQDIIGGIFNRKSGKTKNFYYIRYTIFTIVIAFLILKIPAVLRFLEPYSNFGNILSGFLNIKNVSVTVFIPFIILLALVLWKNRIFCTTICPVGTALGLCAKFGYKKLYISDEVCVSCGQCEKECPTGAVNSKEKTLDNERCIRCMRCVAKCPANGIIYGHKKENIEFKPSRRTFITTGIIAAATIGIFAKGKDIAKIIIENIKNRYILPPGASSQEEFLQKCTNCGLCVEHCKGKVLKKSDKEHETVYIDYTSGKCQYDCKNCSDVCPTGAIKKMTLEEKQNTRIGLVKFDYEICSKCGLCAHMCPKSAISHKFGEKPVYNPQNCIGCGACKIICPVNAIEIVAINKQTRI